MNEAIFKAYDIRGRYPEELDKEAAQAIARAFAVFISRALKTKKPKIVVSRDARLSSPELEQAVIQGLQESGALVIRTGLASTPLFYFSVNAAKADGGLMVTASHNPKEWNGLKLVGRGALPIGLASGLREIKAMAETENFPPAKAKSSIKSKNFLKSYVRLLTSDMKNLGKFKIVIDNGNGMAGFILPHVFKKLKTLKIIPLYFKPDGSFPNHEANPLKKETLVVLKAAILKKQADFGVAFDGDGDRVFFLNKKGECVSADFITALIAREILKNKPGAKIIYDPRSSRIVRETVEENGGEAIISPVGHSFFKHKMRECGADFGGELSGHYYLKDFWNAESGIFTMIKFIKILSDSGKTFEELIQPFQKYFHSGEINFEVGDKERIMKLVEARYKDAKNIAHVDGLSVEYDDWWFNLRASNTENLLRLNLEAKSTSILKKRLEEIKAFIKKAANGLAAR